MKPELFLLGLLFFGISFVGIESFFDKKRLRAPSDPVFDASIITATGLAGLICIWMAIAP